MIEYSRCHQIVIQIIAISHYVLTLRVLKPQQIVLILIKKRISGIKNASMRIGPKRIKIKSKYIDENVHEYVLSNFMRSGSLSYEV